MAYANNQSSNYTPKPSGKFEVSPRNQSNQDSLEVSCEPNLSELINCLRADIFVKLDLIDERLHESRLDNKIDGLSEELKVQSEIIRALEQNQNNECFNCKKFQTIVRGHSKNKDGFLTGAFNEETESHEVIEKFNMRYMRSRSNENDEEFNNSRTKRKESFYFKAFGDPKWVQKSFEKNEDFENKRQEEAKNKELLEELNLRTIENEKFSQKLQEELITKSMEINELRMLIEELSTKTKKNEKLCQMLLEDQNRKTMENMELRGLLEEQNIKEIENEKLNLELKEKLKQEQIENDKFKGKWTKESEKSCKLLKINEDLGIHLERLSKENKKLKFILQGVNIDLPSKIQELDNSKQSDESISLPSESLNSLDLNFLSHIAEGLEDEAKYFEKKIMKKMNPFESVKSKKKIENYYIESSCIEKKDTLPLGENEPEQNARGILKLDSIEETKSLPKDEIQNKKINSIPPGLKIIEKKELCNQDLFEKFKTDSHSSDLNLKFESPKRSKNFKFIKDPNVNIYSKA